MYAMSRGCATRLPNSIRSLCRRSTTTGSNKLAHKPAAGAATLHKLLDRTCCHCMSFISVCMACCAMLASLPGKLATRAPWPRSVQPLATSGCWLLLDAPACLCWCELPVVRDRLADAVVAAAAACSAASEACCLAASERKRFICLWVGGACSADRQRRLLAHSSVSFY